MCLRRFDDNSYTRMQFLRALSRRRRPQQQALSWAHAPQTLTATPRQSDEEQPGADASTNAVAETVTTPDSDLNDCNVQFVTCCHQRFCEACANDVERQGRGCPICRTDIQMILCLF